MYSFVHLLGFCFYYIKLTIAFGGQKFIKNVFLRPFFGQNEVKNMKYKQKIEEEIEIEIEAGENSSSSNRS